MRTGILKICLLMLMISFSDNVFAQQKIEWNLEEKLTSSAFQVKLEFPQKQNQGERL